MARKATHTGIFAKVANSALFTGFTKATLLMAEFGGDIGAVVGYNVVKNVFPGPLENYLVKPELAKKLKQDAELEAAHLKGEKLEEKTLKQKALESLGISESEYKPGEDLNLDSVIDAKRQELARYIAEGQAMRMIFYATGGPSNIITQYLIDPLKNFQDQVESSKLIGEVYKFSPELIDQLDATLFTEKGVVLEGEEGLSKHQVTRLRNAKALEIIEKTPPNGDSSKYEKLKGLLSAEVDSPAERMTRRIGGKLVVYPILSGMRTYIGNHFAKQLEDAGIGTGDFLRNVFGGAGKGPGASEAEVDSLILNETIKGIFFLENQLSCPESQRIVDVSSHREELSGLKREFFGAIQEMGVSLDAVMTWLKFKANSKIDSSAEGFDVSSIKIPDYVKQDLFGVKTDNPEFLRKIEDASQHMINLCATFHEKFGGYIDAAHGAVESEITVMKSQGKPARERLGVKSLDRGQAKEQITAAKWHNIGDQTVDILALVDPPGAIINGLVQKNVLSNLFRQFDPGIVPSLAS